jgi:hypothetical protein
MVLEAAKPAVMAMTPQIMVRMFPRLAVRPLILFCFATRAAENTA